MTYNLGMVLVVYLSAFLLLKFLGFLLGFAGKSGYELAVNLWAIHFVFAAMMAMVAKGILNKTKLEHTLDNGALTRIAGSSVDLMVAAAIGAISITVVAQYWLPILVMTTLGGAIVWIGVPWLTSRIFKTYRFHRALIVYGACTGTMPTGLALLRVVDPDFETPVATDYMYASAITFFVVIPFILGINLPAKAAVEGNFMYFWMGLGLAGAYLLYAIISLVSIARKRGFKNPATIWLPEEDVD
jgi:ESS family glutamate:Na+ symporter